jgi:gliding motility-associated-like protein
VQPQSGANASIDGSGFLTLDYSGLNFAGTDYISIRVCDNMGSCTTEQLEIEVVGDIIVYNAVSPNGDGINDFFFLEYIDVLPDTQSNRVTIYNRWGDAVFEVSDYNNSDKIFVGLNNSGNELPSGTYFYKIEFSGKTDKTGYLSLKR